MAWTRKEHFALRRIYQASSWYGKIFRISELDLENMARKMTEISIREKWNPYRIYTADSVDVELRSHPNYYKEIVPSDWK
jgi:hypothetical protein